MRQIFAGALLVVAGIAAFIEAHTHRPRVPCEKELIHGQTVECVGRYESNPVGLAQTPYDIVRIGAWALVIVGTLLVTTGLIRYWRAQPPR